MPYDPDNPPAKLKKLSKKKQRQWVKVYTSAMGRYGDEGRAHRIAWGTVGKAIGSESFETLAELALTK